MGSSSSGVRGSGLLTRSVMGPMGESDDAMDDDVLVDVSDSDVDSVDELVE